ncbi:MAG: PDZ domain-containing protein [Paracoccaceae bacterium]
MSRRSRRRRIWLRVGDLVVAVNDIPVATFNDMKALIEGGEGAPVLLSVDRAGGRWRSALTPRGWTNRKRSSSYVTNWRIGIGGGLMFEPATRAPSRARRGAPGAASTPCATSSPPRSPASTT